MYTTTPDEHFVVTTHPGHENVVLAVGLSGHGLTFVPVMGEILADLAWRALPVTRSSCSTPSRFAIA